MLYNKDEHSRYVRIAGKISIAAAVVGLAVFMVAFLVDVGSQQLSKVSAQTPPTATTTLTVLNTPPEFYVAPYEAPDSETTSPTNTGDNMVWEAVAFDSNARPYFLLICSDNASPTPDYLDVGDGNGTGEPRCDTPDQGGTAIQWGVSAATPSNTLATVSTTTASTAISQFAESNVWYAWVCDDDQVNPRCSNLSFQGPTTTAASSSPFFVNNRPNLSAAPTPTSADPGGQIVFTTQSTDPDSVGGADELLIVVCQLPGDYNPATNDCDQNFLASTTISFTSDATATFTLPSIIRDQTYPAEVFLIDEHGHESANNPLNADFTVNNVAPTVAGGDIRLQQASTTLILDVPGGETEGFTLDFTISDANSCLTAASTTDEIAGYQVALFRDDLLSTTTCDGVDPADYNANNCYTSAVATTTWNLECTNNAVSACTSPLVDQIDYTCTFPLWFIADPTDAGAPTAFADDIWSVGVAGFDNDSATSTMATTSNPKELQSFTALDLLTAEIPYGALEAGDNSSTTNATTTVLSIGNTGLDQEVLGADMCGTFSVTTTCAPSPTSTIPTDQQEFSAVSFGYGAGTDLSSTSNSEVELDVNKSTVTTTPNQGITYWGIAVPDTITLSGSYQGLNTFFAVTAEPADW